jgi:hypothetical protein
MLYWSVGWPARIRTLGCCYQWIHLILLIVEVKRACRTAVGLYTPAPRWTWSSVVWEFGTTKLLLLHLDLVVGTVLGLLYLYNRLAAAVAKNAAELNNIYYVLSLKQEEEESRREHWE